MKKGHKRFGSGEKNTCCWKLTDIAVLNQLKQNKVVKGNKTKNSSGTESNHEYMIQLV